MPDSADQPYFLITRYERIARMKGFSLRPGDRVLDFGCGSGAMVYRLRDAGYDASGFDIMDTLSLRNPGDMKLFSIAPNPERFDKANPDIRNPPVYRFDWSGYRLPFDDNEFDFVVSQETFEHVMDPAAAIRELARITKPGGFHIHTLPGRWQMIEPHIHVPLRGVIQNYPYFRLWASLGIRNHFRRASAQQRRPRTIANTSGDGCITRPQVICDGLALTGSMCPNSFPNYGRPIMLGKGRCSVL